MRPSSNSGELWRSDDNGGGDDDDYPVSLCSFLHCTQLVISSTHISDKKSVQIKYYNTIWQCSEKLQHSFLLQIGLLAVVLRQLLRIRDSSSPTLLANLICILQSP